MELQITGSARDSVREATDCSSYGVYVSKSLLCPVPHAVTLADEIKAANEKFMSRYASGDMKSLSQLYVEDCKIMPAGMDVVEGRAGTLFAGLRVLSR